MESKIIKYYYYIYTKMLFQTNYHLLFCMQLTLFIYDYVNYRHSEEFTIIF